MALSGADLQIAMEMLDLYADAERRMTQRVERRLARGITQPGWNERKLLETRLMRQELEQEVWRLQRATDDAARAMINTAYRRSAMRVEAQFGGNLIGMRTAPQTMTALQRSLASGLQGTHFAILRQYEDVYRDVVARSAALGVAGAEARRGVARDILRRFHQRGVTGFTDRAGRRWNLQSYAHMASRTAVAQAHLQGTVDRLEARNIKLGRITDAPEECELCRPWEGKIIRLTGSSLNPPKGMNYPTLEDAKSQGLFHPNCKHGVVAYIPELEDVTEPPPQPTPQRPQPKASAVDNGPPQVINLGGAKPLGNSSNEVYRWTDPTGKTWAVKPLTAPNGMPLVDPTGELGAQALNRRMGEYLRMPNSHMRSLDDGREALMTEWVDDSSWMELTETLDADELSRIPHFGENLFTNAEYDRIQDFDYITQNIDRHQGNYLVNRSTGEATSIDHDQAFYVLEPGEEAMGVGYAPLTAEGQRAAQRALDDWATLDAELSEIGLTAGQRRDLKARLERAASGADF